MEPYNVNPSTYTDMYDDNLSNATAFILPEIVIKSSEYDFLFQVLYIVIPVFGLPGNLLAVIVMGSNKEMRHKPVNLFMIHQSAVDFCTCLVLLLTKLYDTIDIVSVYWLKVFLCRFWVTNNIFWGLCFTSGNNLTFLTLERYWATKKPLEYDADKVRRRLPIIFPLAWFVGLGCMFPKFGTTRVIDGNCVAYNDIKHSDVLMNLMPPYYALVSCILPAVVMIYCYTSIGLTLRKSASFQKLKDTEESSQASKMRRAQNNVLQICVILMVVFVVCWGIHNIGFLLYAVGYFPSLTTDYYRMSVLFVILNSCLNPYIYSVRYKEFQNQLKALFTFRKQSDGPNSLDTMSSNDKY